MELKEIENAPKESEGDLDAEVASERVIFDGVWHDKAIIEGTWHERTCDDSTWEERNAKRIERAKLDRQELSFLALFLEWFWR